MIRSKLTCKYVVCCYRRVSSLQVSVLSTDSVCIKLSGITPAFCIFAIFVVLGL